jgi:ABC-type uncharacterized transport system substrate-binding protein
MNRLLQILALAVALVGPTATSHGQVGGKNYRIGFVALVSPNIAEQWTKAFRQELGKFGYEEGKNLEIESRFANGNRDRLKDLVTDLAGRKVDVFLTAGSRCCLPPRPTAGTSRSSP